MIRASLFVVLLLCMVGMASADEWVGGLWFDVDSAPDWGDKDVTKTFTLPAAAIKEEGRIT